MRMPSKSISIRKPDKKSVSLFLWLNMNLITAAVRFVFNRFGISSGIEREIVIFLATCIPFIVLLIGSRRCVVHKETFVFWGLYLTVALAASLSLLLYPNLKEFYFRETYGIEPVFRLDGAIFAFLFFVLFDDSEKLRKVLMVTAYVTFFYLVFVVLLPALRRGGFDDVAPGGGTAKFQYSLSLGYDLLLPLTLFFTSALKTRKLMHYGLALICAILIVIYGGRGAIVVMALFFALLLLLKILKRKLTVGNIMLVSGLVLIMAVIVVFGEHLLTLLKCALEQNQISSRNIQRFLSGSFTDPNGRDLIWKQVTEAIGKGGLFGYGFFGDRQFGVSVNYVGYAHNLFLELLANFGIIGACIIVYFLVDAVRMLFLCKDENWKMIYIVLFICSCKLLFSLSLWYAWEIWAAAAVAYKYRMLKRTGRLLAYN